MRLRSTKISSTGYNVGGSVSYGDPDALAYISALTATGITVSESRNNAITTFIVSEKAAGRWDGIKRLYFPIWGVAAANAICMKSLTSCTFNGAFTHASGYIQGGVNKYISLGATLSTLGLSVGSHYFAGLFKTAPSGNYKNILTADLVVSYGEESLRVGFGGTSLVDDNSYSPSDVFGIVSYGSQTTLASRYCKVRKASGVTSAYVQGGTISGSFAGTSVLMLGTASASFWDGQCGALVLGTYISTADDLLFTTALNTLWYSCVIGSDNPANAAEPNATAWVLMDGPFGPTEGTFYGGQSWRKMEPIGYFPYGNETYTYGDEVVRFDGGAWIYENATLGEIARAWSTAQYPWLATTWNNGFTAAKVTSTYEKTTNYPAVP